MNKAEFIRQCIIGGKETIQAYELSKCYDDIERYQREYDTELEKNLKLTNKKDSLISFINQIVDFYERKGVGQSAWDQSHRNLCEYLTGNSECLITDLNYIKDRAYEVLCTINNEDW